jgi:F-type H+-transporting ATPase subunit c
MFPMKVNNFIGENIGMSKFRMAFFTIVGILMSAAPIFAQADAVAGDNANSVAKYAKIAAGIGFAIAAGLGALGQGRVAASAAEGTARNPGASGRIQTVMIIGLAFIETLVIFTLVIMFAIVKT